MPKNGQTYTRGKSAKESGKGPAVVVKNTDTDKVLPNPRSVTSK